MERTHMNGTLNINNVGEEVTLVGWVNKRRNLGSLVFIDLRDRSGLVQCTFDESMADDVKDVRNEYVLQVKGVVQKRQDANPNMATGEIEVSVKEVYIINSSKTPPIDLSEESDSNEDTRLTYRYLDLRRSTLQNNLILRHKVCMIARNVLDKEGFVEIETPILARSTPEGARDYLVPSRIYNGKFWALPQSPQIYKQLLMISGMEKYFQIARCFRDEDLRSDRQPEFTQIDIEMSFTDEEEVFGVVENLMREIFNQTIGCQLPNPFKRLTWDEALERYGSDKPDLRFGNEIQNISSIFENTEFQVFKTVLEDGGEVECVKFENAAKEYSRKKLDELQEFIKRDYKAKALAYLKMENGELSGSIAKPLSDKEKEDIIHTLDMKDDDLVLVVADKKNIALNALGALRSRLGKELNLIGEGYEFVWITDFPMFEYSEEEGRYIAQHHPFTAIKDEDVNKLLDDPGNVYSKAYDLVINGYELLSGSIRIHDQELQEKVFEAIGLTMEEAKERFGFFLDAFQYGTPPHGGVGIGLERLVMVLANTENIRDVVAFPTTNSALDLMSEAPNVVDEEQLKVLGISITKNEDKE